MRPVNSVQRLLALSVCFISFSLFQDTPGVNAQEKTDHPQEEIAKVTSSRESPIDKLGKLIAGSWEIDATSEPREPGSKGGKDVGTSTISFGPGKLALIEDYQTHGDGGKRVAMGVFWWDDKAQGYRTMFCESRDPSGCSVYNGLGNWEGADWIFHAEFETKDKKKLLVKEVLTATSPSSFTATFYRTENDGPYKLDWTVKHTKTSVH